MAVANQTANIFGPSMAIRHLCAGAIDNLVYNNKICEFYELVIDIKNQRNKLDRITKEEFLNLREGIYLQKEIMTYMYAAIEQIIEKLHLRVRTIAQNAAYTRPGKKTLDEIEFMSKNSDDMKIIKQEIPKVRMSFTDKSLFNQLSHTIKGWHTNNMYKIWVMGRYLIKDNFKIAMGIKQYLFDENGNPITYYYTKNNNYSKNNKNGVKKQGSYNYTKIEPTQRVQTNKPTTNQTNNNNNNNNIPKIKISIYERKQEDKIVGYYYGKDGSKKISGTGIPYDDQYCPNYQIWSSCNLQFTTCKKKHACSFKGCGSQTHGYAHCSKNPYCRKS